jgi:hypothetical protein
MSSPPSPARPHRAARIAGGLAGSLVACLVAQTPACSPGSESASSQTTSTSTAAHTGSGAGGAGGAQGTGGEVSFFDGGASSTDGGELTPDAACAATASEATNVPVSMLIMFDKSGSMKDNSKWVNTTGALKTFFGDPATAGLRVGLRFFPDSGCDSTSCSLTKCSEPLVAPAPLTADPAPKDVQEQALLDAIASKSPGGDTPMSAALGGAELWATTYLSAHPAEKAVVILVTDGEPNGCDNNISHIAKEASDARALGVYTYAIGLAGSNEAQLNQIATAGGAAGAFFVGNDNAAADLLAALKSIQSTAVSCEFQMPASDNGQPVDPAKVNVSYLPGGDGAPVTFGQVGGQADCTPQKGGWYYDDPKTPAKIVLCPSTCTEVQADPKAKVDVLLGCATTPAK